MGNTLYTLDVCITSAPVAEAFAERNPTVCRAIEIRGEQTLAQLHAAIFSAFDRWEEHMYEFQFGKGPHDPAGERYQPSFPATLPFALPGDDKPAGDAAKTTIASLKLEVDSVFGYWFDFGDDWYHEIKVLAIGEAQAEQRYPRVTARTGESPPQYADWDEEDDEDDEESDVESDEDDDED